MSAKNQAKKARREGMARTLPQVKPMSRGDQFFETREEDRWNLPFDVIRGMTIDIPISQITPDPNQPRTDFSSEVAKSKLEGLAKAIKKSGQQMAIVVNFFSRKDGRNFFCIDKGERRWNAHKINKMEYINCVVQKIPYQGEFSLSRFIAQLSENCQRHPHTNKEIVQAFVKIYEARIEETGREYGAKDYASKAVAEVFGEEPTWGRQFASLSRLLPKFVDMLDPKAKGVPAELTFFVGIALSAVPQERQEEEYQASLKILKEKDYMAQREFIARRAKDIKVSMGVKIKGRTHDEKRSLERMIKLLRVNAERHYESGGSTPYGDHMRKVLSSVRAIELDSMRGELAKALSILRGLDSLLEERRTQVYKSFQATDSVEPHANTGKVAFETPVSVTRIDTSQEKGPGTPAIKAKPPVKPVKVEPRKVEQGPRDTAKDVNQDVSMGEEASAALTLDPFEENEGHADEIPTAVTKTVKATPSSSSARNRIADLEEDRKLRLDDIPSRLVVGKGKY